MGIVQSVMRYLGIVADGEEEKAISKSDYVHQWRKGNPQTGTHEGRYLSVTVGEVRGSSSLAHTIVPVVDEKQNQKQKQKQKEKLKEEEKAISKSDYVYQWRKGNPQTGTHEGTVGEVRGSSSLAHTIVTGIVKDNCPNVTKARRRRREEFPVTMKCRAAEEVEAEAVVREVVREAVVRWITDYCSRHRILLVGEGDITAVPVVDEKQNQKQKQKQKEKLKDEEKERKIKHYSSKQKILLVGEGDFSFSACLAVALGSATNIIATSLNSKGFLKKNYGKAANNIEELRNRGGKVMHGIDATEISKHKLLNKLKYDRIVFNFPHAGFFPPLSTELELRKHRRLVSLFLKNAKEMINGENGEIHITHKTNGSFHAQFYLESIASSHGLRLVEAVKFKLSHYPGYNTKYGFGGDDNFNCNPSKTFKFALKTPPF